MVQLFNHVGPASVTTTVTHGADSNPANDVATLEGLIKEGRAAVEKQDDEQVKSVMDRLEKEAHRMASVMYGAQGAPGAPPGANGGPPGDGGGESAGGGKKKDDKVIDAEFEETGG